MNTALTITIVSACLLAAAGIGMRLRRLLPGDHLSPDSRDTVKLAMGLVATTAALLLGLLISSATTFYETTHTHVMKRAAVYSLVDRILAIYGPQAAVARGELHTLIEEEMRRMWPVNTTVPVQSKPNYGVGNAFYVALLELEPRNDRERTLKAQALNLALELGQLQSLMQAESTVTISKPMLIVVVAWLVMIFLSFSLIAPSNATANFALIASSVCTAGAIFLILELNQPFGGFMRISSKPMLNVLHQSEK